MPAETDPVIKQFREKISDNDLKLIDLLNKRVKLVTQLWQYKRARDMDVYAPAQEDWLLTYVTRANKGPITADALHEIYRHVIEVTQHEARRPRCPRRPRSRPPSAKPRHPDWGRMGHAFPCPSFRGSRASPSESEAPWTSTPTPPTRPAARSSPATSRTGRGSNTGCSASSTPTSWWATTSSLGHRVHLASGTRILNDVEIADDCVTTGIALIGNHVRVRTGSCISKSVIVDDWCFIAAGIMSSHTKNVYHGRPRAPRHQLVTRFGYGTIIGSRTNTSAGVIIAPGSIVGYGSHVVFDLATPHGIYYNSPDPWATLQSVLRPTNPFYIEVPSDYVPHRFDPELLRRYLPHASADADLPQPSA